MAEKESEEFGASGPGAPLLSVILRGRCPRCGKGPLFDGFLAIAARCSKCGLDFSAIDTGDGPAVFVILIAGFLVVVAALVTEVLYSPPYWVQLAVWLPLTLILTVGLLRPIKAGLAALQYKHRAAPARHVP